MSHAGAKSVPPMPKGDIDQALHDLESNKGRWVAQNCAARAKLLRASITATLQVGVAVQQDLLQRFLLVMRHRDASEAHTQAYSTLIHFNPHF